MGPTDSVCVIHAAGLLERVPEENEIESLQIVADHAGNRLGLLPVMAENQLQASTDGLTGLVNRRTLGNRMRSLRMGASPLRAELRSGDSACRYGGEEFAIVLPGAEVDRAVEVCIDRETTPVSRRLTVMG